MVVLCQLSYKGKTTFAQITTAYIISAVEQMSTYQITPLLSISNTLQIIKAIKQVGLEVLQIGRGVDLAF